MSPLSNFPFTDALRILLAGYKSLALFAVLRAEPHLSPLLQQSWLIMNKVFFTILVSVQWIIFLLQQLSPSSFLKGFLFPEGWWAAL